MVGILKTLRIRGHRKKQTAIHQEWEEGAFLDEKKKKKKKRNWHLSLLLLQS